MPGCPISLTLLYLRTHLISLTGLLYFYSLPSERLTNCLKYGHFRPQRLLSSSSGGVFDSESINYGQGNRQFLRQRKTQSKPPLENYPAFVLLECQFTRFY